MKTFKENLSVLLCVVFALGSVALGGNGLAEMLTISAKAETLEGNYGKNLTWKFTDDTLTISGTGDMEMCSGYDAPWALRSNDIKNVIIGNSVTSYCKNAFSLCYGIESFTIGDGIKNISDNAFGNKKSLETVIIGNGVESIGDDAFYNCTKLENVTIGCFVTSIGDRAFYGCKLNNVTIPDSVISIGDEAFYGYEHNSVSIGKNLCSIGDNAFGRVSSFNVTSAENNTYSSDEFGVLFNRDKTEIILYPTANTREEYIIPYSVTSIGDKSFYSCNNLTNIIIPDSVTSIGNESFCSCNNLTNIIIPDNVTSIGEEAFMGCRGLQSVKLPDGITNINYRVFYDCRNLGGDLVIPDKVTSIGNGAFEYCSYFDTVELPVSVASVGNSAFYQCGVGIVRYAGTREQKSEISIGSRNDNLKNTRWEYEYIPSNMYVVTFVNEDGTELQSSEWEYNTTPAYSGKTPEKEADAQNTYEFAGWDPKIVPVTEATVYTATFTAIPVPAAIVKLVPTNANSTALVERDGVVETNVTIAAADYPYGVDSVIAPFSDVYGEYSSEDYAKWYVTGIPVNTREANLGNYVTVTGGGSFELENTFGNGRVGTGNVIVVKDADGNVVEKFTIVIYGDLDGNGVITNDDMIMAESELNDGRVWSSGAGKVDYIIKAADLTQNGRYTNDDRVELEKYLNNKATYDVDQALGYVDKI